jgi:hypothetical protein
MTERFVVRQIQWVLWISTFVLAGMYPMHTRPSSLGHTLPTCTQNSEYLVYIASLLCVGHGDPSILSRPLRTSC